MGKRSPDETRDLSLPAGVVAHIEARLHRTRFDSPDAYAAEALSMLLQELEDGAEDAVDPDRRPDNGSAGDEELKDRLESLGYL